MPASKATIAAKVANAAAKAVNKELSMPVGLAKVYQVSPTLKKFLGVGEINRSETMKKLWAYIKDHQLQDPSNKREILCDKELKSVFGKDRVHFLEVPSLLNIHFPKKEDKKS